MVNRDIALAIGLTRDAARTNPEMAKSPYYRLGRLEALTAMLIEGSKYEKQYARKKLALIIATGRRTIAASTTNPHETYAELLQQADTKEGPCLHIEEL